MADFGHITTSATPATPIYYCLIFSLFFSVHEKIIYMHIMIFHCFKFIISATAMAGVGHIATPATLATPMYFRLIF